MVKKIFFLMTMSFGMILQTVAQKIPSYVPTNGLVGWWPFNGNANDESGNGNNGTVNGATLTADRNGVPNKAYSFNGMDYYIKTSRKALANFSVSLWLNTNQINQYTSLIDAYNANWEMYLSNLKPTFTKWISLPGTYQELISNSSIVQNQWNHLVYSYSNGNVNIYLNNKLINSNSNIYLTNNVDGSFYFGASISGTSQFYNGKLDDIAIYNRAITPEEITNLYKGCSKETATLNPTNGILLKNASPITLRASPVGGVFAGEAIANGQFAPAKANLGTNTVNYHFTNSTGCQDTTQFKVMVYDTLGNTCSTYDTLKIKVKLTAELSANHYTNLSVYPNPTADVLIIDAADVKLLSGYTYRIVDLQGNEVYKAVVSNAKTEISLKTIGTKGIYILHILDANNTSIENKKIVLE